MPTFGTVYIAYEIPGFGADQLNQLRAGSYDGRPVEGADWDCVPTLTADALNTWAPRPGRPWLPDEVHDLVYHEGYVGGQALAQYAPLLRDHGVLATRVPGTPAQLMATVHREVPLGHLVVATIPSLWALPVAAARARQGAAYTTHVVAFFGVGPGCARASNPWTAPEDHDGDDAYWQGEFDFGEVWVLSPLLAAVEAPNVSWTDAPDGGATDDKHNHIGAGINAARAQRGITADSYAGEVYVSGATTFKSFVAFGGGEVASWDGTAVSWDGAKVAAELMRLLNVERSKPAPTPTPAPADPLKDKVFAWFQGGMALAKEL